jgi:TolB-like protein
MKLRKSSFLLLLCLMVALPTQLIAQPRDPNRVYKVAILPFMIHSQENLDYLREGIYDIISSRITVEGRITVIERSVVERALYEEKPMRLDEAAASKIGMKVGADYIVLGSLTKVGDYISLDARLVSITEEKPPLTAYTQHKGIDDVMVKIGDFAQDIGTKILGKRQVAGRSSESKNPLFIQSKKDLGRIGGGEQGYKQSQTFSFEIRGLDVGDVDGDKKNELVVIDSNSIYIFKYDGEKMSLMQKIETGSENNFLTVDVADLNQNGHAEIIVTSIVDDNLRSFILEHEEGRFKKITEKAGWFFRVLNHPKEGPMLIGQQRGSDGLPVDPIYRMVWKKKSFEKGPKMPFPSGTLVFDIAMADLRGKGKPDFIALDKYDRLNVYSNEGKLVWRSGDYYGGTNLYYQTFRKYNDTEVKENIPYRINVPGRIVVKDINGDGTPQIIINKNEPTSRLFERARSFEWGEIHCLSWDDSELITMWKTRQLKTYIADYQVKDVDNDGNDELIVAVTGSMRDAEGLPGLLSKKTISNILFFKLY